MMKGVKIVVHIDIGVYKNPPGALLFKLHH